MKGGKVAFIDSDYFVGMYDTFVGEHGEAGRSSAHEFGHLAGLGHEKSPLNLMCGGGLFRSVSSNQLANIYSNWKLKGLNQGKNYTEHPLGRFPNVGLMGGFIKLKK